MNRLAFILALSILSLIAIAQTRAEIPLAHEEFLQRTQEYFAAFPTSQLIYAATEYYFVHYPPPEEFAQGRSERIEIVRDILQRRKQDLLTDEEDQHWAVVSDEDLQREIKLYELMVAGLPTPATYVYSVSGADLRKDVIRPWGNHFVHLAAGQNVALITLENGVAHYGPVVEHWYKTPDIIARPGSDLIFPLAAGAALVSVTPDARQAYIEAPSHSGWTRTYEITFLDDEFLYWTRIEEYNFFAECDDFIDVNGLLVPCKAHYTRKIGGGHVQFELRLLEARVNDATFEAAYFDAAAYAQTAEWIDRRGDIERARAEHERQRAQRPLFRRIWDSYRDFWNRMTH